MSRRGRFILSGGLTVGALLIGSLVIHAIMTASTSTPTSPRPPELGGQQVPARVYEISFDQKYDVFCSFYAAEPTIYRNCKILGFTGREEGAVRSGGFSFASSSSYYKEYFDHWLVLKLADGRLAYIPPDAVKYIEEASPASPSP